jgi:predicted flap endonuclease-1-like 5' DNA nuclease
MNDTTATSTPGASLVPDGTSAITTVHFALIAILAVLALLAILYGMRLKRRRREAERTVEAHNAETATKLSADPVVAAPDLAAPVPHHAPREPGAGDAPVTTLKGLGPRVAARLEELGITSVGQLAALDDDAAARLDAQLGSFAGRMARDRWLEQARFLAAGDRAGFEAVFGKL